MNSSKKYYEKINYDSDSFYIFQNNTDIAQYKAHWHDAVELIMPVVNTCEVVAEEGTHFLNEFDILILPYGEPHKTIKPFHNGQRIILQFDIARLTAITGISDAFHVYSKLQAITPENSPQLHESVKKTLIEMLEEHMSKRPFYDVSIVNKIISLTLLLGRNLVEVNTNKGDNVYRNNENLTRFHYCTSYINQNFAEDLSLERVAKEVNFSKFHFSRWFQKTAGETFYDYLMKLRFNKAEALLLSSSKSITEIALDSGFKSTTTFNRVFKQYNNCTPTEYRKFHQRYIRETKNADDKNKNIGKQILSYVKPELQTGGVPRISGDSVRNPLLLSDFPDPSIIRVGNYYYMTSTTMHFNPGCPIMRSSDLVNWKTINYTYDILDDSDKNTLRNGETAYGKGSWASCLRFYRGFFYIVFASFTTGKTYIFQTQDIENGPFSRYTLARVYHDPSLFFEDDGRAFLIYREEAIRIIELTEDATAIKVGGLDEVLISDTEVGGTGGLPAEGAHFYKINGKYYLFLISWPPKKTSVSGSGRRLQICYRSDFLQGSYEGRVVLDDGMSRCDDGVAQGGIVEAVDGNWYALLFQDHGAVGRVPVLVPVKWEDDWPIFGIDGQVPEQMTFQPQGSKIFPTTVSDEFYLSSNEKSFISENDNHYHYSHLPANFYNHAGREHIEEPEILSNTDFSEGLFGWTHREIAKISIIDDKKIHDKQVILVENRVTTGSGLAQDISGKLTSGRVYEVTAGIKYTHGTDTKDFIISIQFGNRWESIINIGVGTIPKNEWGIIKGTYTAASGINDNDSISIFIETKWSETPAKDIDLINFYVEHFSFREKPLRYNTHTLPGESEANGSNLALQWQFNHNPNNNNWSLLERPGFFRLKSSYLTHTLASTRNTITQRTFGHSCTGVIALETHGLQDGDIAGLAALQYDYGYVCVRQSNGKQYIVMVSAILSNEQVIESIPLDAAFRRVYLKLCFDFNCEKADFYYSLDELRWTKIGDTLPLKYKLEHFTGYRFAVFYISTQIVGGYADFDYFRVSDTLIENNKDMLILNSKMTDSIEVAGMHGNVFSISVSMDSLPNTDFEAIHFSMCIPPILKLENVIFEYENICGDASFELVNGRFKVSVAGDRAGFINNISDLFFTIHFSVNGFVSQTETLCLRPDYLYVEGGNVAFDIHDMQTDVVLHFEDTGAVAKIPGNSNPLITHKLGADQHALVHNGRLYLYLSADVYEYDRHGRLTNNTFKRIDKLNVISSTDLLNWTDHGEIKITGVGGITHWATSARKPCVVSKIINGHERFFLYFSNGESNIGVLVADSPLGPWEDVLGRPFIHRGIPGVEDVIWCFDPDVLVDDDGSCYIYFGGGVGSDPLHPKTARVIRLGDDMISISGKAISIDAPTFYEASGINKINGKYYYSYCTNFVGDLTGERPEGYPKHGVISYMLSSSPLGPFEYAGVVLNNPIHTFGGGGNSHHCIFEFKNEWFITYHTQTLDQAKGRMKGYRSPHINKLEFFNNGLIKPVQADMKGVVLPGTINPYVENGANTFAWCLGIGVEEDEQGLYISNIHDGDWICVANVDFGKVGASRFAAKISSQIGGEIELRLDSPNGKRMGSVAVGTTDNSSSWQERKCDVRTIAGIHHVFFIFRGDSDSVLFKLKNWIFEPTR